MRYFSEFASRVKLIRWNHLLLAAAAVAAGGILSCSKDTPVAPNVWAIVDGKEIKREDVDKYYRTRVNAEGPEPSQEEALTIKLSVLDELIRQEILFERAKKLNLEASDGEVEDKFTELKSPYTEDEFQKQLKESGDTIDDLKVHMRRQISIQKLLNREVVAKISITDQDLADFYNQNRAQFNVPETRYLIAQIVVTPVKDPQIRNRKNDDATTEAEAKRKVAMLMDRLNSGVDFSQLAADYSEDPETSMSGGILAYTPESALNKADPALKRAVLALRPGQISPVIALKNRYAILKLLARDAPGQRDLSDTQIQQTVRNMLKDRKEQLLQAAYLSIARDEAHVTNFLARRVMESNGKLPDAAKVPASGRKAEK